MITMQGNTAQLWRYKVEYEETTPEKEPLQRTEYAISDEHLEAIKSRLDECTVKPIDQTDSEWIDGMEFETREAALDALEMGEEAYWQYVHNQDTEARLQEQLLILANVMAEMYEGKVS